MFPNNNNNGNGNNNAPTTSDEIIGINGIPKPKSLLSSFLFSRLSSPVATDKQQQQQQQQYQTQTETGFPFQMPSSLQSSALPTCLLGEHAETINDDDNRNNNDNPALRSRTVTDDANTDAAPTPMLGNSGVLLLPRPRRSWNISNDDRKLPKVPEYYYPHLFDPNCTALVTDSPPSIVVVRISECLRRRSIAVEYDDDSVTAKCMTVDRTHFIIQLYRSSTTSTTSASTTSTSMFNGEQQQQQYENNGHDITMMTGTGTGANGATNNNSSSLLCPPNDSIIVECRKTSGDSMSFHAACYKILMAAKGLDNGNDERPSHRMNGLEFRQRIQRPKLKRSCPTSSTTTTTTTNPASSMSMMTKRRKLPIPNTDYESASDESTRYYSIVENNNNSSNNYNNNASYEEALEAALDLLEKDRLDCQQLGMERLVHLTTRDIVGKETSSYISKRLLQQGNGDNSTKKNSNNDNEGNRWRLIDCLMHPGAEQVSELELPGGGGLGSEGRKSSKQNSNNSYNENYTTQMIRSFLESSAPPAITPSPAKKNHHQRHQSLSSSFSPFSRGQSFLKKKSSAAASATTHNRRSSSSDIIDHQKIAQDHHSDDQDQLSPDELRHEAKLRSLALRVFCNALDNLSKTQELHDILYPNLNNNNNISAKREGQKSNSVPSTTTTRWIRPAFLLSLVQDLQGAGRPPSVSETGYKLASVHEAALAVRSLRLLSGYHSANNEDDENDKNTAAAAFEDDDSSSPQSRVRDFLRSEAVLERLEYARSCGRATHAILQYEAECTYNRLTEDVRSC